MQKKMVKDERTRQLADRLMEDIQNRQLASGDPYYTTIEAAEFLKVSGASANRALKLLARKNVLKRSQKKGAIIDNPQKKSPTISYIHFIFDSGPSSLNSAQEGLIHGVQEEMSLSHITYSILPIRAKMEEIFQIITRAAKSDESYGIIMVNSTPDVQKQIGRSGIPSVLLGTRCLGVPQFSSLDFARESPLRLLLDYLHNKRKHRIVLLMPKYIQSRDIETLNTAMRMDVPYCFFMQHSKEEPELVDEVCELIEHIYNPDGFICYNLEYANAAAEAIKRLGKTQEEIDVTVMTDVPQEYKQQYTHAVPLMNINQIGHRLGQILHANAIGLHPQDEEIPVRLSCPYHMIDQTNTMDNDYDDNIYKQDWAYPKMG